MLQSMTSGPRFKRIAFSASRPHEFEQNSLQFDSLPSCASHLRHSFRFWILGISNISLLVAGIIFFMPFLGTDLNAMCLRARRCIFFESLLPRQAHSLLGHRAIFRSPCWFGAEGTIFH